MLTIPLDEKRRIIERRILAELALYYSQHKIGLPMQTLSAKYSKALKECGGFPEFIESMRTANQLRIEYSGNGARTVWPGNTVPTPNSKAKEPWF